MSDEIKIRTVTWQQSKQQLASIRTRVFIEEQHVPPVLEWDEHDKDCLHLLALDTADHSICKPVATARMLADGHIGRMAVLPDWRNKGVGSALLTTLIDTARKQGLSQVFLFAQNTAIEFYQQHGFTISSVEFMDAGIPHHEMRLTLRKD